jgi:hypothetical protein
MPMKLSAFIAGAFGVLGFVISIMAGLGAGNSVEATLLRGLLCAGICYVVGYFVGIMAQQVALEHAQHVAKVVAEEDRRREQEQAEQLAANGSAAGGISPDGVSPASTASPGTG